MMRVVLILVFFSMITATITADQDRASTALVLERSGSQLHYWLFDERETAPWVILTHGATMDHRMFESQIPILSEQYRVLAWDVRGHGHSKPIGDPFTIESAADDLLAILDQHEIEQAVFVGQSMGSYISQEILYRAPERVLALVSIGGTALVYEYSPVELNALRASLNLFRLTPYNQGFKRLVATNTAYTESAQEYAYEAISQLSREEFLSVWSGITQALRSDPEYRISVPLLITHGEHDLTGTVRAHAPLWADRDTEGQYIVIPDAGHNANQDNPEFFNQILLAFLSEHLQE